MAKHYGLTKKPGEGVTDKTPSWMESLFTEKMTKTASTKKASPFEGVNDSFLNPHMHGVNSEEASCELCGKTLSRTEIDCCEECNK